MSLLNFGDEPCHTLMASCGMNSVWCRRALALLLCCICCCAPALASTVQVYLYHLHPPFLLDPYHSNEGLANDLVTLLNQAAPEQNQFKLTPLPRGRLNRELAPWLTAECSATQPECDSNWMVLFVTPAWGWGEKAEQKFQWLPLFDDADLVISPTSRRVIYQDQNSFQGKVFGTVTGHKYTKELEDDFDRGQVTREDVSQVHVVLERLIRGRVDVSIIQKTHYDYLLRNSESGLAYKNSIYVASKPLKSFRLQVMLPRHRTDLTKVLSATLSTEKWCQMVTGYGIEHSCPVNQHSVARR